jgi:hypothetical protein
MNMTTNTSPLTADTIISNLLSSKGQFVRAIWKSNPTPAAAHKKAGITLEKKTSAIVRSGINFAQLSAVKEGIASGDRPEVGELPFGRWKINPVTGESMFPYVIETDKGDQIRMYPSHTKSTTIYFVNGEEVAKEKFAEYLTPSDSKKLFSNESPLCFTVKRENIIGVEDFSNQEP